MVPPTKNLAASLLEINSAQVRLFRTRPSPRCLDNAAPCAKLAPPIGSERREMPDEPLQARVEGALNAHFKQDDGSSRPGTDWKIGLKRGDETQTIFVRAYLADGVSKATRDDTAYQGQTVIGYVFDRLGGG
jgi:hypothetical protein